ncbi:uncharacterized protein LOC111404025 isoform X2 [Olea europaea var. sylvestris]|uniref:uncharacterized protein LOC111404025 isoform X2 n=1 Tax=Olea europaea var. sylvestris TaxID=158386 RepID=UPI000C1D7C3D|nr:uncharacterized protein LOC111404025 isoform X2 [Olea europaea var. sylvestris]
MIKKRYSLFTSSANFHRNFRYLRGNFMAAAPNFLVGQRDLQIMSPRRLLSNISTASAIDTSNGRFIRGLRFKCCRSENYGNKFQNNDNDIFSNSNAMQKARAFGPYLPQFLFDSVEVRVEDRANSVDYAFNGARDCGSTNRGNSTGFPDQLLPEKIMIAVDVDEVLGNFVSALNQFIADRYSLNHSVAEYHVYEFFKLIYACTSSLRHLILRKEFIQFQEPRKLFKSCPNFVICQLLRPDRMQLRSIRLNGLRDIIRGCSRRSSLEITLLWMENPDVNQTFASPWEQRF